MDQHLSPLEVPEILPNDSSQDASHPASPIFLIVGSLLIFVGTAAVLFFNYKQTSKASIKENNIYLQKLRNNVRLTIVPTAPVVLTPTPASVEEASIENVILDDGTEDLTKIDQTASSL